jgi:hypothetical protein
MIMGWGVLSNISIDTIVSSGNSVYPQTTRYKNCFVNEIKRILHRCPPEWYQVRVKLKFDVSRSVSYCKKYAAVDSESTLEFRVLS